MIIKDIIANRILPFEIEDVKLMKLFSFYLHSAPTIESRAAAQLNKQRLLENWECFRSNIPVDMIKFFSESYPKDKFINSYEKYKVNDDAQVNRRTKSIVCKKKEKGELEHECLLRHLRNSIAHDNVYLSNAGNRKYILFEDFNSHDNPTARILLSQADLVLLKKEIMR